MGTTESAVAESLGWDRTQLSTMLRRLDEKPDPEEAGPGNLRSDTLFKLERVLGKSIQWILKGEESQGVALRELPEWPTLRAAALARYKVSEVAVDIVGRMRFPAGPARIDEHFVGQMARTWMDAM